MGVLDKLSNEIDALKEALYNKEREFDKAKNGMSNREYWEDYLNCDFDEFAHKWVILHIKYQYYEYIHLTYINHVEANDNTQNITLYCNDDVAYKKVCNEMYYCGNRDMMDFKKMTFTRDDKISYRFIEGDEYQKMIDYVNKAFNFLKSVNV